MLVGIGWEPPEAGNAHHDLQPVRGGVTGDEHRHSAPASGGENYVGQAVGEQRAVGGAQGGVTRG
jgi:hypothetical protein